MENLFDFEQETVSKILTAIKKDDKKAFADLTANSRYFSLCFGKFPILSLLYLYESNKILTKFEKDLVGIKDYIFVDEDFESNHIFKEKSSRAIRLFKDNEIVTPPLMLAILGYDFKLKTFLKHGYFKESEEKIIKTYELSSTRQAEFKQGKLVVEKPKLTPKELSIAIVSIVLSIIIIAVSFGLLGYSKLLPDGSSENPYLIKQASTLLSSLTDSKDIKLTKDIYIENESVDLSSSNINGNGHTIYLSNQSSPLIKDFSGTITNLKIVISDTSLFVTQSVSPFILQNKGSLKDIEVNVNNCSFEIAENTSYDDTGTLERYISTFTCYNFGSIDNCTLNESNITLIGDTHTDSVFGLICSYNLSTITNCKTKGSDIVSDTIDLGGIVGKNYAGASEEYATIENCSNYVNITQSTALDSWSVNVGGIAFTNYDIVKSCSNYGNLTSSATSATNSNAFCGGIVARNTGFVGYSINKGDITASSLSSAVYAGGIVAYSSESTNSEISYCGASGTLKASVPNNVNIFVGGIVGTCIGYFGYNYSTINYEISASENYACVGGLAGALYGGYNYDYSSNSSDMIHDSYYLKDEAVSYGMASFIISSMWYGNTIYLFSDEFKSIPVDNVSEIEALEFYIG